MSDLIDTRITVIGAGAVGGLLASQLARASLPVVLWGRDAQVIEAIAQHGLKVTGVETFTQALATASGPLPDADLYVVATKTTANRELAQRLAREAPVGSRVLVAQNGLDPESVFAEYLGEARILRAILYLGAKRMGPAEVDYAFWNRPTVIGGHDFAAARATAQMLAGAGHPAEATEDVRRFAWEKGILNAITNPLCAIGGRPIGEVMQDPRFLPLLHEAMAVAEADGVSLGPDFEAHALKLTTRASAHRGSMWEDVLAGRPTEIEAINGRIVELAERWGVPAPTHRGLVEAIKGLIVERRV